MNQCTKKSQNISSNAVMMIIFPDQLSSGVGYSYVQGYTLHLDFPSPILLSSLQGMCVPRTRGISLKTSFSRPLRDGLASSWVWEIKGHAWPQALIWKHYPFLIKWQEAAKPTFYFPTLHFNLFSNTMTFLSGFLR